MKCLSKSFALEIASKRRVMQSRLLILWAVLITTSIQAKELSLESALSLFRKTSPFISLERTKADLASTRAKKALSPMIPSLSLSASKLEQLDDYSEISSKDALDVSLNLKQTFFAGGKNYFNWKASLENAELAKASFHSASLDLELELITNYLNLLGLEEIYQYRIKQVSALEEQLRVVKSRFELGSATIAEQRQAEARLAASQGARSLVESRLKRAQATLASYLESDENFKLIWPDSPKLSEDYLNSITELALEKNPMIEASQARIKKANFEKSAQRSEFLPEISGELRLRERRVDDQTLQQKELVLSVSLPLFDGLKSIREAQAKILEIKQASDQLATARLLIRRDSRALVSEYQASKANLLSLELAVASASEAKRAFEAEYQSGRRSLSEVLLIEDELIQSQIAYVEAKLAYYLSSYRLQALEGQI